MAYLSEMQREKWEVVHTSGDLGQKTGGAPVLE
jgi:hypothetical protein